MSTQLNSKYTPVNLSTITITESIIVSMSGMPSVNGQCLFDRKVKNQESVYQRIFEIGEEWIEVDFAHLKGKSSYILIKNMSTMYRRITPTQEVTQEEENKRVLVSFVNSSDLTRPKQTKSRTMFSPSKEEGSIDLILQPHVQIYPRDQLRVELAENNILFIRSNYDQVKIQLVIIPS